VAAGHKKLPEAFKFENERQLLARYARRDDKLSLHEHQTRNFETVDNDDKKGSNK